MQLGRPVVEACLQAGTHYFDTTGETDWMFFLKREFGRAFAGKELVLCPWQLLHVGGGAIWPWRSRWKRGDRHAGCDLPRRLGSQRGIHDVVPADVCAATVLHQEPGTGAMAPAQRLIRSTFPAKCTLERFALERRREPVWYEGDGRVRNCQVLVVIQESGALQRGGRVLRKFEAECRQLDPARQEEVTNEWGKRRHAGRAGARSPGSQPLHAVLPGSRKYQLGQRDSARQLPLRADRCVRCRGRAARAATPVGRPSASLLPHGHSAPAICSPLRQRRDTWPMK